MPSRAILLRSSPSRLTWPMTTNASSNVSVSSYLVFSAKPNPTQSKQHNGFLFLSQIRWSITAVGENTGFMILRRKIEVHGVNIDFCTAGMYNLLVCPECKGGKSMQRSLSFHISENWDFAMWRCFHASCGWAGQVLAGSTEDVNLCGKSTSSGPLTEENLRLEKLGDELLEYFAGRMISEETLHRNRVMQGAGGQKIAFTYRLNGLIVGCKYRTIEKRFWQEKGTEKLFYGLDDITGADEIIIVEGEVDKLSMEEAGYYNCVSVPGGAPQTVSTKEPPTREKDISFQYLWNCRKYLDKASRIILATDSDIPGQALAEELARRLGRERCLLVNWPKRDEFSSFKDANEVLKHFGADGLRDAISKAKIYGTPTSY